MKKIDLLPDGFKEVPGYEGYYAVNEFGEVYSVRKSRVMGYSKKQ